MKENESQKSGGVQSIDRALQILKYVAVQKGKAQLGDVCARFELNRTTAWRILSALERNGFAERSQTTKCYSLGLDAISLCTEAKLQNEPLIDHSISYMKELMKVSGESVLLSIPKNMSTVTIAQVDSPSSIRLKDYSDQPVELYCSSNGKVMLGYFSEEELDKYLSLKHKKMTKYTITNSEQLRTEIKLTKERGFGIITGELDESENGVSVPILHDNRPVAFISVAGPAFRFSMADMLKLAPAMLDACVCISRSFARAEK